MKAILMLAISFITTAAFAQDQFNIMPKELVQAAEQNGCEQVKNFFSLVEYIHAPPFVYGPIGQDSTYDDKSAAFWCRKKGTIDEYWLIITVQDELKDQARCKNRVDRKKWEAVTTSIGGLSIRSGKWSLKDFVDVETGKRVDPRRTYTGRAIYSSANETADIYICSEQRWVRGFLH